MANVTDEFYDSILFPFRPKQERKFHSRGTVVIPTCPELTLACDSITASKSKCVGYAEYVPSTPPKFYKTKTTVVSNSGSRTSLVFGTCFATNANSESSTRVDEYDLTTCVASLISCSGTGSSSTTLSGSCGSGTSCSTTYDPCTTGCTGTCCSANSLAYSGSATDTSPADTATVHTVSTHYGNFGEGSGDKSTTYTLSNEITDDPCDLAAAALPSYSGTLGCHSGYTTGQGCVCSSYKNLSSDETSCTIRRFKYQLLFTGVDGYDLDITWCERFVSEDGMTTTYTSKSFTWHDGDPDNTDIYEVMEPSTDGTIDICCIRCCLLDPLTGLPPEGAPDCEEATCP